MKLDKISLDGKKTSIDVKDTIFSTKINETLISQVIYKTNANFKGRKAKTKQKNESDNLECPLGVPTIQKRPWLVVSEVALAQKVWN